MISQDEEILRRSLRRLRVENKFSLAHVGELLGVHKSHVLRMEKGSRTPPPQAAIARAFEVKSWEVKITCAQCSYLPPEGFTCQACGCDEPLSLTENVKTVSVSYVTDVTDLNRQARTKNLRIPVGLDEYSEAGTVDYLMDRSVKAGLSVEVTGYKYCN